MSYEYFITGFGHMSTIRTKIFEAGGRIQNSCNAHYAYMEKCRKNNSKNHDAWYAQALKRHSTSIVSRRRTTVNLITRLTAD